MIACILPGPTTVIATETETRWCFGCRQRVEYRWDLMADEEPSYYEPIWVAKCPNGCGDRRLGFGMVEDLGDDEA